MTNSELLAYTGEILGSIERQRQFILRLLILKRPCPNCSHPSNYFEANGTEIDNYQFGADRDDEFKCPACHRGLTYVVPLFSIGPSWTWHLVPVDPKREPQS